MDDAVAEIYLKNIADVTGENDCAYIFEFVALYISASKPRERDGNLYAQPPIFIFEKMIQVCVWPPTADVRNKSIHHI
jgi:hypothetical protein